MAAVERVQIAIRDREGIVRGHIVIHLLPDRPSTSPSPLLHRRFEGPGKDLPPVQLLESHEYRYKFVFEGCEPKAHVTTDRPEILRPDTSQGVSGRLRPGLYTGTLPVTVFVDGESIGTFVVEVRSRKLDYLTHYEWMLSDLADTFAELIMRSFGPTEARFAPVAEADAPTLYQRFAFIKSMLKGSLFDGAIQRVIHNPHREWVDEQQQRSVGQTIAVGSAVARALTRGGRRVTWEGGPLQDTFRGTAVRSLPAHIPVTRTHATEDTVPNRFVKYVLIRWRDTVAEIADALRTVADGPVADRGRRETAAVLMQLDELLAQPLFRELGALTHLPAGNQVLQKRAGYRELYRLYVQFELAAVLSWSGGDDVYGAGQKDVAVLYEYWIFLQLARTISNLCDEPLPLEGLLQTDAHGLDIRLRQGQRRVLKGSVRRLGRELGVELWYNRTFPRSLGDDGSWTQTLRPDCSLRITTPGYEGEHDEVWIHFDAKYRLDVVRDVFQSHTNEAKDHVQAVGPLTEDLLKMHAYRDAIRRSSGAYVVYPGSELELRRRYHEILPGLGAFALIPSEEAQSTGLGAIRNFIDNVFDHTALQITRHERHRFWEREIYEGAPLSVPVDSGSDPRRARVPAAPFLSRPPADTLVLLGYVRNAGHYNWIRQEGLYNLRADERSGSVGLRSRELSAQLVLLYGPDLEESELWAVTGDPRLLSRQRLHASGYPSPRGALYYCLPVDPVVTESNPVALRYGDVRKVISTTVPDRPYGAPVAVTWLHLMERDTPG